VILSPQQRRAYRFPVVSIEKEKLAGNIELFSACFCLSSTGIQCGTDRDVRPANPLKLALPPENKHMA